MGMQFQLPDLGHDNSDFFPFFSITNLFYKFKNSKTTKAKNRKFGQMISLYMKLCTCIVGGATLRGLGQMRQKL